MKKIYWIGIGVVAIIAIFALYLTLPSEPQTIKIGYIGPMTGNVAVLGTEAANALTLAVEQVNARGGIDGKHVDLYIEDDQYDTAKTVQAYNNLVNNEGVKTILVSTYGGLFAIADRAAKDHVLLIDALDCDADIAKLPENVFCVAKETQDLANVIADFAIKQGYKKVGILYATVDKFMPSVAQMFTDRVAPKGIKTVPESYPAGTSDFRTSLKKLDQTDALVLLGYDEIGLAMKQAREMNMKQPFLTIPSVATTPSIQKLAGAAINGTYFSFYAPLKDNPHANAFLKAFKAKYGRGPYVFVASDQAYDAATLLLKKVLPAVKGKSPVERLNEEEKLLHEVKDFPGVTGTLTMQPDGRISGIRIRLFQLENTTPVYVSG